MSEYVIANARIHCSDRIIENGDVKVKDGIIVEISSHRVESLGKVIDAKGSWLLPGLIDIHVNGGGGGMSIDASEESIHKIISGHAKYGTTGMLITTISVEDDKLISSLEKIDKVASMAIRGSKILGVHLEGPFLNAAKKGAHQEQYLKMPSLDLFNSLYEASNGRVKILSLAPELDNAMEVIKQAKKKGVVVGLAHSAANYATTQEAIKNGLTLCTHLFNAMEPLSHKDPGPIGAFLTTDSTFVELITDGVHVNPIVLEVVYRIKGSDKIIIVTDAVSPAATDMSEFSILGINLEVRGKSCFVPGTNNLAGSALTMNLAVKTFYESTNCSLLEVINMASLNPCKLLELDKNKGSIEVGKDADLILMDENFNVKITIVEGEVVYQDV